MLKLLCAFALCSSLLSCLLLAEVAINNKHKGMDGVDGSAVNCAYCHQKAAIPKAGKDHAKYKSGPYCRTEGCH